MDAILNFFPLAGDDQTSSDPRAKYQATKQFISELIKSPGPAPSRVLIALIGAVDLMMVGNLGSASIAAVGITNQPKFLVLATILALNTGVTVLVSRRKGAGRQEEANTYSRQALLLSVGFFSAFLLRRAVRSADPGVCRGDAGLSGPGGDLFPDYHVWQFLLLHRSDDYRRSARRRQHADFDGHQHCRESCQPCVQRAFDQRPGFSSPAWRWPVRRSRRRSATSFRF